MINPNANIFWIADNGTGVSTLYRPDGAPAPVGNPLVVTIPPTSADTEPPIHSAPTGIVFNPFTGAFHLSNGQPAAFIFDGEDGSITAWNGGANAAIEVDHSSSGAVYKGLALAVRRNGGSTLYATNFHSGTVDLFDSTFNPVTLAGAFVDPNLPKGYAPFGIATFDNLIYVTFAKQDAEKHDDVASPGNGFVDVFDTQGKLMTRLISRGVLNSPWGLAEVPRKFGKFDHDVLLVGNFGDGKINAFNIHTGYPLGPLKNRRGEPLEFNGLWALFFFDDRLYFTAGIGDESHGLFGFIKRSEERDDHDSHE